MKRECCLCHKKIADFDSYSVLDDQIVNGIICAECFEKLDSDIDIQEKKAYFEPLLNAPNMNPDITRAVINRIQDSYSGNIGEILDYIHVPENFGSESQDNIQINVIKKNSVLKHFLILLGALELLLGAVGCYILLTETNMNQSAILMVFLPILVTAMLLFGMAKIISNQEDVLYYTEWIKKKLE